MSQASDQRKREILMRVAATRLGALDAAVNVRQGAESSMRTLLASRRTLGYAATALGGLVLSRVVLRALRPRPAVAPAGVAIERTNPLGGLLVQLVTMLLLPLAQQYVLGKRELPKMPELHLPAWPRIDFSTLFYRWLGLIK